jgi:predicted cupin superfamily sugar epimerase
MPPPVSQTAGYWIAQLDLSPHPEGGHYRQTYKSELTLPKNSLPDEFHGDRCASTAIYFLLEGAQFSAFHRIASDELWHFYAGSTLVVYVIDTEGNLSELQLGPSPELGETFQAVVPAGCWFASQVQDEAGFALVGCTVAPGFDFADFAMAERAELARAYPQHKDLITKLTRA